MTRFMLLLSLISTTPRADVPSRRSAVVTRITNPPRCDGQLTEWSPGLFAVTPPVDLSDATTFTEEGSVEGDADQSAQVWLTTTRGMLHLAAQVTDDDVRSDHDAPNIYQDDGIELLLSQPDAGVFHLGVSAQGRVWVFRPQGASAEGISASAVKSDPGYSIELSLPLNRFGATDRTLHGWKVNLALRDVDAHSHGHRVWSGYRHAQATSMGQLVLASEVPAPKPIARCAPPRRRVVVDQPITTQGSLLLAHDAGITLRLVNYQPAQASWEEMWTRFDTKQLAIDFTKAAEIGANAIRIFVFYSTFGEHAVRPESIQQLKTVVDLAAAAGLLTVVSFFPFDKEFRKSAWPGMGAHLEAIVRPLAGHPGIAMWDLMNEPDHRWAQPDSGVAASDVEAWAREMYARVKRADPTHLVTVGLAGHFARRDGGIASEEALPFADVISVHGYFDDVPLDAFLSRASSLGKPVVLQEYGRTRLYWTSEEVAAFDESVCSVARAAHLAGIGAWELLDHPVGSISWLNPKWKEAEENWFGLLSASGERWPRAQAFCRCIDAPAMVIARPKPSRRN